MNSAEVPASVGLGFNPYACALPTSGVEIGGVVQQGDQALYDYISMSALEDNFDIFLMKKIEAAMYR